MEYKTLTIKGAILNQEQLEKYLEKIATDHNLQKYSSRNTYPIPRLEDNFEVITEVYNLLNENIKLNIPIHPAGEWILDNYYVIDKTVKNIKQELSLKKYKKLAGLSKGNYEGFARIYVLASEIVNFTNNKIETDNLKEFLKAYQTKKSLSMDEIWMISIFLNIAIIENIREICEKIYNAQIQKYKAENIIERLVENKEKNELKFDNLKTYKEKVKEYNYLKYPFIEYLSYKLKKYGKKAYPFINVLEEEVNKLGTTLKDVVQKEHFDIALRKTEMANCITSIRTLERINMSDIFEEINGVEDILKKDPAKVYALMDYNTKESYRNEIKKLSNKTKLSEIYIANKCLEMCKKNKKENEENKEKSELNKNNDIINKKKEHIGYYLISNGKNELLEILTGKKHRRISNNTKLMLMICINIVLTIAVCTLVGVVVYRQIINSKLSTFLSVVLSLILSIILFIPTYSIFVQIMQYALGKIVKPKIIPKLDYIAGVPCKSATFVVIPTIVKSREKVKEIMKKLEVFYMANKSENIYFALLGDCTSSKNEEEKFDKEVIEMK